MKENNDGEKQKKLFALLRELSSVQNENMRLSFGIHARNLRSAAKDNVRKVTNGVVEGAKKMGRGAQKLADDYVAGKNGKTALKDYEARIAELEAEYEDGIKGIRDEIARLEAKEIEQTTEIDNISQKREEAYNETVKTYDLLQSARQRVQELTKLRETLQRGGQISDVNRSLSSRIDELRRQLEETKENRKLAIDNDDRKADSQGKRKQIRLNRELRRYTRTLNKVTSKENKKLEAEIAKVNAELETAKENLRTLRTRHTETSKEHASLCEELNKKREERENTRRKIRELQEKEKQYATYAVDTLTEISNVKKLADEQRAIMPKQNVFQRMFGFMVHNFNGAAKFTAGVIAPIGTATKRIVTEEIPKAGKGIVKVGKQTIKGMADKYQEIKANMIRKAEEKLEDKLAKNQELKAKRDTQKGIKRGGEEPDPWGGEYV